MKFNKKIIFLGVFLAVLCVGIFSLVNIDKVNLKEEIVVTIKPSSGAKTIAKVLKDNRIIKNESDRSMICRFHFKTSICSEA